MARRKQKKSKAATVVAVLIVIVALFYQFFNPTDKGIERPAEAVNGSIEIYILDVGQADCTVIRSDAGNILIDAGDRGTQDEIVDMIRATGATAFEYVIFTHPDSDHIGGADEVVNGFDIKNIIMPELHESSVPTSVVYSTMIAAIEEKTEVNVIPAVSGDVYEIGELKMKILAPNAACYENINDYSVATRFDFGATSFLFTGDALEESEKQILSVYPEEELKCTFFQAGHHGASNANTLEFMRAVSPQIVAVSCGANNKYGHPTGKTLETYADVGAVVYRTDELGTIVFVSNGETIVKK